MECKIFGTELSRGDEFRAELQAFCELDHVQRDALAQWFESTADFDLYAGERPAVIQASTLLPEQFRKTASPIRFLLDSWQRRSLQIADIERDLLLLGLDQGQLETISRFLVRVSAVRRRVWLDGLKGNAQTAGLPILDPLQVIRQTRSGTRSSRRSIGELRSQRPDSESGNLVRFDLV